MHAWRQRTAAGLTPFQSHADKGRSRRKGRRSLSFQPFATGDTPIYVGIDKKSWPRGSRFDATNSTEPMKHTNVAVLACVLSVLLLFGLDRLLRARWVWATSLPSGEPSWFTTATPTLSRPTASLCWCVPSGSWRWWPVSCCTRWVVRAPPFFRIAWHTFFFFFFYGLYLPSIYLLVGVTDPSLVLVAQ